MPVCCPSRATLLSGRLPHNNRVTSPDVAVPCCMHMGILFGEVRSAEAPPDGSLCSNPRWWRDTFNVQLQRSGYNTGIFGKAYHMGDDAPCGHAGNGYGPRNTTVLTNTSQPFMLPGWDRFFVYCYPLDQYFWNRFNDQGELVGTRDAPEDYATALLGNKTVEWLRNDAIPEAKRPGGRPFFAYVPLHAPHGLTTPAPWYNETWPASWGIPPRVDRSRPNWGYHARDHHWLIANEPAITPDSAAQTDRTFVQRLQMLLSADDAIDGIVTELSRGGVLSNTFLAICSDHGWNLGEFRVMNGKHQMYDHTIRVPFAIAGPGISAGRTIRDMVSMVDVAPTLLSLAGVDPDAGAPMDGRSFAGALLGEPGWRRRTTVLVEFYSLASNPPDERPCGPLTPGTGPFETKPGRDGCPAGKALGAHDHLGTLRIVETQCDALRCGSFTWHHEEGRAWFCSDDMFDRTSNGAKWPQWTVGHRKHQRDGSASPCFDRTVSHSDVANNTFIGLRILNATASLSYAEYTDVRDWNFDRVYKRELFDLKRDPFQLENLYGTTAPGVQAQLHEALRKEFECAGRDCGRNEPRSPPR